MRKKVIKLRVNYPQYSIVAIMINNKLAFNNKNVRACSRKPKTNHLPGKKKPTLK